MENITERQQQLYEWIQTKQAASIEEIERRFKVSVATAYRDARALVAAGLALKTPRGIKLASSASSSVYPGGKCAYCGAGINPRAQFILQMEDGTQRTACCSHCGLMALGKPGVQSALACDFLYGKMINARQAFFVIESLVSICCEPSALCFASEDEALRFQKGFGGKVYPLDQAKERVGNMMDLG